MQSLEDLQNKLNEAKAKAALPVMSDEDEKRAALRSELAKAEARIAANEKRAREAREDDLFADLEIAHASKFPDEKLHRIDTEAGMIVMRPPSISKGRAFQQVALKGKLGVDQITDFVTPCVVYPDPEALEGMLEKYSLLSATLCQFAQEVGSGEAKRREGK